MKLSDIGEFALIERFSKSIKLNSSVIKGPGDDCAVIKFNKDKYLLFTCDMIVEGVDFVSRTEPELIGRKALAVSLSDIAACAGLPSYALVSLGLPADISLKKVELITQGLFNLARAYRVNIVGGDLSRSDKISINTSILGFVEKDFLVLRNGARKGDIIFVSGPLGGSKRSWHLRFKPRLKEARYLVKNFRINSMIDISDGLAQDLAHILKESSKGAVIYEDLIPLNKGAFSLKQALSEGEDFELLFTLSSREAKKLIRKNPFGFKPIGEILDDKYGLMLVNSNGRCRVIQTQGFQHF